MGGFMSGYSQVGNCTVFENIVMIVIIVAVSFLGLAMAIESSTGLPAKVAVHKWMEGK
jgi:hypothetical protein